MTLRRSFADALDDLINDYCEEVEFEVIRDGLENAALELRRQMREAEAFVDAEERRKGQ